MAEMVNYLKRVEGDLEGIGKDRDKKKREGRPQDDLSGLNACTRP